MPSKTKISVDDVIILNASHINQDHVDYHVQGAFDDIVYFFKIPFVEINPLDLNSIKAAFISRLQKKLGIGVAK